MSPNLRRSWEAYFILAIFLTMGRAYSLFTPGSPEHIYFKVLSAFYGELVPFYVLSLLQITVMVFHWLPLLLYIFGRALGPRWFWKIMLVSRVILDVAGNSYAKNIFVSIYNTDPWLCVLTFSFLALPYVPWYWACFRYAFVYRLKTKD